jgi:hypothetical protein
MSCCSTMTASRLLAMHKPQHACTWCQHCTWTAILTSTFGTRMLWLSGLLYDTLAEGHACLTKAQCREMLFHTDLLLGGAGCV